MFPWGTKLDPLAPKIVPCGDSSQEASSQSATQRTVYNSSYSFSLFKQLRAHLFPIVILDINTGLRGMELLTLKPEHIDFHRGVIYVKGTKSDEDREVPINNTARNLLTELVSVAKQNDHEYLFTNPKTKRHHACIKSAWNTACRKAGIANLRFHDLRHTFGTRAVDNGASIAAVQKVMGHKSIETTMQYVHATDEGKRRAVEAVEKTQKPVASGFPVTIRTQNEKRRSA